MNNIERIFDVLIHKKSIIRSQETFTREFEYVYHDSDKKEKAFLLGAVDQMFKKYHYSAILPGTDITPASIMFTLAEREFSGSNVFFPRITVYKEKNKIEKIRASLHVVNSEFHHMIEDFEVVLNICKTGLIVDKNGIPEDKQRMAFEDKLFYNDRHYLNIIILVAINLKFIQIVSNGKKYMAVTTPNSKELSKMNVKNAIKLLVDGIINNCTAVFNSDVPEFNGLISNEIIWEMIKNPKKINDILESVYERFRPEIKKAENRFSRKGGDYEQAENAFINGPASHLLYLFYTMMDIYLFTPLGFYMQIIKPLYAEAYNIFLETGTAFNVLSEDFNFARNMLFFMPTEFDLTALGEEIYPNFKKTKSKQNISKQYKDDTLVDFFDRREEYLLNEMNDLYAEAGYDYMDIIQSEDDFDTFSKSGKADKSSKFSKTEKKTKPEKLVSSKNVIKQLSSGNLPNLDEISKSTKSSNSEKSKNKSVATQSEDNDDKVIDIFDYRQKIDSKKGKGKKSD